MSLFFRMLCDTRGRRDDVKRSDEERNDDERSDDVQRSEGMLRRLTLSMLRSNAGAFRDAVQQLSAEHQSVLQLFVRSSMEMEAAAQSSGDESREQKKSGKVKKASDGKVRKEKKKKKKREKLKL